MKHEQNSKERYGKPRTFQKGLTYDMCENVCVSNQTCNFFTHTPKGLESHARSYAPLRVMKILIKWHDQAILLGTIQWVGLFLECTYILYII